MIKGAWILDDEQYRYTLDRVWDPAHPMVSFIGLNPSTADATKDDATIRRCVAFARGWDAGGMRMLNLFAYRATNPMLLRMPHIDSVGPDNDGVLAMAAWASV